MKTNPLLAFRAKNNAIQYPAAPPALRFEFFPMKFNVRVLLFQYFVQKRTKFVSITFEPD